MSYLGPDVYAMKRAAMKALFYKIYSKLTILDISLDTKDDRMDGYILEYLLRKLKFQEINISGCDRSIVEHLLENSAVNRDTIEKLIISSTGLDNYCLKLLASLIINNEMPNLEILDISNNYVIPYKIYGQSYENECVYPLPVLLDVIARNNTIETLVLSGNTISDTMVGYSDETNGALALAYVLKENNTLMNLEISRCQITPEGAERIARALKVSQLRTLDFSHNPIGKRGVLALAGALKVNTVLIKLDISDCDVDDDACEAIVDALTFNFKSGLMILRLKNNLITDKGAQALLDLLDTNTSLKEIDIGGNESIKDTDIAVKIDAKLKKEVSIRVRGRALYV